MPMTGNKNIETLLGDPKKAIKSMVFAFFIAMAVIEINQFVDTFWVAGLGNITASAVATVVPIYGLMMCAGVGIGVGATASISYRIGQGDFVKANKLAVNSLILSIMCAILASVLIIIFSKPLICLMGAEDLYDDGFMYLLPLALMSPFLLCNSVLGGILRAEGAAKKSTIVQVSAAIFNMVLDPILIYGAGLGVFGAGLSTAVSSALALGSD
jgi:Na+-driven multidrug efflux pump